MFSQDEARPQDAAAAGPTNEGTGGTQRCRKNTCKELLKCLNEAKKNEEKKKIHILISQAKDVNGLSNKKLYLEDAIKMYLAAQLAQLPKDEKDKFSLWMRDDKKLTPRELKNYREAVNISVHGPAEDYGPNIQATFDDGIAFLKDVVCGDFDIEESSFPQDDPLIANLKQAMENGRDNVCSKDKCRRRLEEAKVIQKYWEDYMCAVINKQKHYHEVHALNHGLALIKKVYYEDKKIGELAQKPRDSGTELRDPNIVAEEDYMVYKRAVNLVRCLQWKGGLPPDEIGRQFNKAVVDPGNVMDPNQDQCRTLIEQRRRFTVHRGLVKADTNKTDPLYLIVVNSNRLELTQVGRVQDQLDWLNEEVQILEKMMKEDPDAPSLQEQERRRQEEERIEKELTEKVKIIKKDMVDGYERALLSVLDNMEPTFRYVCPTVSNPATLSVVPKEVTDSMRMTHISNCSSRIHELIQQHLNPTQSQQLGLGPAVVSNLSHPTALSAPSATKRSSTSGESTIPSKARADDDPNKPE